MYINLSYDKEASKLVEKPTFYCDEYMFTYKDIAEFKRMGLLKLVEETTLPEEIPCQVIMYVENAKTMKYIFFNTDMSLPPECYDEPLLNRNLIERSALNGGFWIEILMPFEKQFISMTASTESLQ